MHFTVSRIFVSHFKEVRRRNFRRLFR